MRPAGVERGACIGGEVCVPGGGREGTRRQRRHVHARGLTQGLGAKGTRGAHLEHALHGRDAGGVEAQRLVEGRRGLPSRREGMRCGGKRCELGGERAWGLMVAHKRHAWGWPDSRFGGQGHARSAHAEHDAHVCDAGGVEAQWLVEGRRGLPSQREGMRCGEGEVRTGRRGGPVGWWRHTKGMHGDGPTQGLGPRARAERARGT